MNTNGEPPAEGLQIRGWRDGEKLTLPFSTLKLRKRILKLKSYSAIACRKIQKIINKGQATKFNGHWMQKKVFGLAKTYRKKHVTVSKLAKIKVTWCCGDSKIYCWQIFCSLSGGQFGSTSAFIALDVIYPKEMIGNVKVFKEIHHRIVFIAQNSLIVQN